MTTIAAEGLGPRLFGTPMRPLLPVLLIGGVIAAIIPFDLAFEAMTRGSALQRVVVFMLLAGAGAASAERVGFRLNFHGSRRAPLIGAGAAVAVAIAVALIDGVLFRSSLAPDYRKVFETVSLSRRLAAFMLRAFNENVFYRLFLFSVLTWILSRLWHDASGRPKATVLWAAAIAAQMVNVGINVVLPSLDSATVTSIAYDGIRYVAPGVAWAWLFSRYGFATAEVASVGCHIFLQPALGMLL
jgi:hypothetical protein